VNMMDRIESACENDWLWEYDCTPDELRKGFQAFLGSRQERRGELARIRRISVLPALLPVALDYLDAGSLRALEISGPCKAIPEHIGALQSLARLSVECVHLETLPESVGDLRNLADLSLDVTLAFKGLPKSLANLQSLKTLELRWKNDLSGLAESAGALKNLSALRFRNSTFAEPPDWIFGLRLLAELEFRNCRYLKALPDRGAPAFAFLPEAIGDLKNLTGLEVSDAPLFDLLPSGKDMLARIMEAADARCGYQKHGDYDAKNLREGNAICDAYCNECGKLVGYVAKPVRRSGFGDRLECHICGDINFTIVDLCDPAKINIRRAELCGIPNQAI